MRSVTPHTSCASLSTTSAFPIPNPAQASPRPPRPFCPANQRNTSFPPSLDPSSYVRRHGWMLSGPWRAFTIAIPRAIPLPVTYEYRTRQTTIASRPYLCEPHDLAEHLPGSAKSVMDRWMLQARGGSWRLFDPHTLNIDTSNQRDCFKPRNQG